MNQEVLLTISILISKKKATIKKCLDSVMPLLQSVPSELILVDTGCDEELLKFIHGYTDNIVKFQWCNDFAKARNAGLKRAKGKWFLYLDDDEWFEDVSEFIEFFNSGQYKKFGYGMYYQRNYSNESGTLYEDAGVYRMVRLESDVHFIYSIHECFNRIPGTVIQFHAFVHHYGYVYQTDAERYAHTWRNIKPLLQENEKEPNNLKHIFQLAQDYNVIGEYQKSIEISEKGIEEWKKGKAIHGFCLNSLYANIITAYKNQYRYEDLYLTGKEYLKLSHLDKLTRFLIESELAVACYELKKYEECISYVKSYVSGYEQNKKASGIFTNESTTVFNSICFEERNLSSALSSGIRAALHCGVIKLVQEWFQHFPWDDKVLITDGQMIKAIVEAAAVLNEKDAQVCLKMCEVIFSRKGLDLIMIDMIQDICAEAGEKDKKEVNAEITSAESGKGDKLGRNWNWQRFADLQCDHWYFDWLRISAGFLPNIEDKTRLYVKIWKNVSDVLPLSISYHIWQQMKKDKVNIGEVLIQIPLVQWENAVISLCSNKDMETVEGIHTEIKEAFTQTSRHLRIWQINRMQRQFSDMEIKENKEKEVSQEPFFQLYDFMDIALVYYSEIYSEFVFDQITDILPVLCQTALKIKNVKLGLEEKNYRYVLSILKEIVEINPQLAAMIRMCSDWIGRQVEAEDSARRTDKNEFVLLAVTVKAKVRELIKMNKMNDARIILQQLEKMLPEDNEIKLLMEKTRY